MEQIQTFESKKNKKATILIKIILQPTPSITYQLPHNETSIRTVILNLWALTPLGAIYPFTGVAYDHRKT